MTAVDGVVRQLRGIVVTVRPPVFVLLAFYAELGLAQAGKPNAYVLLAKILAATAAFLVFSVACNDLADEAIDRVNLSGDPRRPLVSGAVSRARLLATGWVAAGAALLISVLIGWPALVITAVGLAVSGAYSVRPVRIAQRGVLAPLLLPACYVAVPYLLGITAVRRAPTGTDLALLGGLYVGFIGRILLKDFRDVRGDAMFGKRTFLVRHGRRWTCVFSACCWAAGTSVMLAAMPDGSRAEHVARYTIGACAVFAVLFIAGLAAHENPRRDEALISAVAILGRAMILILIIHLSAVDLGLTPFIEFAFLNLLGALALSQATSVARHGPRLRLLPVPIEQVDEQHSLAS